MQCGVGLEVRCLSWFRFASCLWNQSLKQSGTVGRQGVLGVNQRAFLAAATESHRTNPKGLGND